MTCQEAEILLHALLDDELDAGHSHEVETHADTCAHCSGQLEAYQELRRAMRAELLQFAPPIGLRARIERALPSASPRTSSRRSVLKGFVMGTALSTAIAASLVVAVIRTDQDQRILGDVLSAHVRSLQGNHLTDVETSDQHQVKPWFNGKLDLAPPVVDLAAQGFALIGGRVDYIDGKAVAAIVYRRRMHAINLFIAQGATSDNLAPKVDMMQGFSVLRWGAQGLEFFAISDINAEELQEFRDRFEVASRAASGT
jgi:anti-sigma factor RsiW